MSESITAFSKELFQDVVSTADVDGLYLEDAFFEIASQYLLEAGEIDAADRSPYSARGVRVDGYGGDPVQHDEVLSLILCDFDDSQSNSSLTQTEMDAMFRRGWGFLEKCLSPEFRNGLEESLPAFGLSDLIASRWDQISKVRLFLLTNKVLSERVDGKPGQTIKGKSVTYSVWDLARMFRFATAGGGREEVDIDLLAGFGGGIPALPAHVEASGYEAYLMVMPGPQLARIYDRWGPRLLEQNVRVFLQARGKVNQGIRNTIEHDPEMFFAYNNGISATAESVEVADSDQGLQIVRIKDFQIVNGGQTTASIHAAFRKGGIDLDNVFVQVKLSIVDPDVALDVVPRISEYANTQNRISPADFFANHPFHVRMETISRGMFAPSPDGTFRESKWFYERARGQYQDERAKKSASEQKKFEIEFPKKQVFTKTDLAKYANLWLLKPHEVSKGAQKNFAVFADYVAREWQRDNEQFNERYFKDIVARAIIFRESERLVTSQPWYRNGYRANIVAYTISKIVFDLAEEGLVIDLDRIWRLQTMGDDLAGVIAATGEVILGVLESPDRLGSNVTEWAKNQACWAQIQKKRNPIRKTGIKNVLITIEEERKRAKAQKSGTTEVMDEIVVVRAKPEIWVQFLTWDEVHRVLGPKERDILEICSMIPRRIPSTKQCKVARDAVRKLVDGGCPFGRELY